MASEAKRGLIRITSNYVRLFAQITLGLILAPFFISWIGFEAYGLIALLGTSIGIGGIFKEMTSRSLVRELGAAYHNGDEGQFIRTYNSAFVISATISGITALLFIILFSVIGLLNIPDELIKPAHWIVAGQGIYSVLLVFLSPVYSMYPVREQFTRFNLWNVVSRSTTLISALILAYAFKMKDPPSALQAMAILWPGLQCLSLFTITGCAILADHRLIPTPQNICRKTYRQIFGTYGWNSAAYIGTSLYAQLAMLLMNLTFGVFGNAVFQIANQFSGWVKMLASGVADGIESVSVRLSVASPDQGVRHLIHHASRLQSLVAFPAGVGAFILVEPFLQMWVGNRPNTPDNAIPIAVIIVRILIITQVTRSLTDGWHRILYGAGYIRRYAVLFLAGGIVSPLVGVLLWWLMPVGSKINAPAIGYSLTFMVVHFLIFPVIAVRCLNIKLHEMYLPLVRPAVVSLLCSPMLIIPIVMIENWTILILILVVLGFGVVYTPLSWWIVVRPDERKRFSAAILRRMPFSSQQT